MITRARKGGGGVPAKRRTEVQVIQRRLAKCRRRMAAGVRVDETVEQFDRLTERLRQLV